MEGAWKGKDAGLLNCVPPAVKITTLCSWHSWATTVSPSSMMNKEQNRLKGYVMVAGKMERLFMTLSVNSSTRTRSPPSATRMNEPSGDAATAFRSQKYASEAENVDAESIMLRHLGEEAWAA